MTKPATLLRLAATAALLSAALPAEERRVTFSPGGHLYEGDPRSDFLNAASRAASGAFDSQAGPVFVGTEKSTRAVFNLPGLALIAKATYRDDAGDNILALWTFDSEAAIGTIALDDTPYFSTYSLHVRAPAAGSEADLDNLLTSILRWDKGPLHLTTMNMGHDVAGGYLHASYFRLGSEFEANNLIMLVAATQPDGWYATLKVGKGLIASFYPNSEFIPERFPPLEESMKGWPEARLLSEIRNSPYKGYATVASEFRDRVLTAELARRGLTSAVLVDLLRTKAPYGYSHRAIVTDGAIYPTNPGWGELCLRDALEMYEAEGEKDAANIVAGSAARHCSAKSEATALGMINARYVGAAAAHYLVKCSNSPEALTLVKEKLAAGELWGPDRTGLHDMEKRVAQKHN